MGSEALPRYNNGIFKSLPTFSPEIKGLTAIVTGANGISGFGTMRVLLESPQRWKKVYTLSRKPPPPEMMELLTSEQRERVEHVNVDFLGKPEDIASAMKEKGVTADAVFFYSYAQPKTDIKGSHPWANAQELADINCKIDFFAELHEAIGLCLIHFSQRLYLKICSMLCPWQTSSQSACCYRPEQRTTT